MTISEHLRDYAQTKRQLAERSGYSVRDVELLIHAARLEGVPILSDSDGYRLATSAQEVEACARRLQRRAVRQMETAQALQRTADRMASGPITLWRDAA